jgi:PPK2 family polyphosphate:nucleotide phosphotransferase
MIKLANFSTQAPDNINKKEAKKALNKIAEEIGELSRILEAEKKHSLLIVLQGMDTSGKDGATRETFKYCSPTVVQAYSFKKPTDEEFAHDFLWRVHKQSPAKGTIKVFIRSHYEDILIQRVHKWIDEERVTNRIDAINAFETLLEADNNTTVLKFYMHLSKEKQFEKLQERIDDPDKQWKHNPGDWEERKYWESYMICYEDVLNRSTIPWDIVPVDQRWYRNYHIAKVVRDQLLALNMKKPLLKTDG